MSGLAKGLVSIVLPTAISLGRARPIKCVFPTAKARVVD